LAHLDASIIGSACGRRAASALCVVARHHLRHLQGRRRPPDRSCAHYAAGQFDVRANPILNDRGSSRSSGSSSTSSRFSPPLEFRAPVEHVCRSAAHWGPRKIGGPFRPRPTTGPPVIYSQAVVADAFDDGGCARILYGESLAHDAAMTAAPLVAP